MGTQHRQDLALQATVLNRRVEAYQEREEMLEKALAWLRDNLTSEGCPDNPHHDHSVRGRWDRNGAKCKSCEKFHEIWGIVSHIPRKD